MKARDLMTAQIVSVRPDAPVRQVAGLLLDKHISAVPVIDESGALLGMVSDGDLIGRTVEEREARKDWWLTLVADRDKPNAEAMRHALASQHLARDIMVGPVITVEEDTDISEVARLLGSYRIKRVPVVRDGRVVGILSRADLLRALAAEQPTAVKAQRHGNMLLGAIASLEEPFLHHHETEPPNAHRAPDTGPLAASAGDFRGLTTRFEEKQSEDRAKSRAAASEQQKHEVAELVGTHVSDDAWRGLLERAREAASQGQKEFMLLRFPSQLCSDGGRAINAPEDTWPTTLRGEAAELYARWEQTLKPQGFRLIARVLEFPGGKPGDIGLSISWGV